MSSRLFLGAAIACAVGAARPAVAALPLPTGPADFRMPGTQPGTLFEPPVAASDCFTCHNGNDDPLSTVKPYRWRGSAHAHAARDPLFLAAHAIANAQAPGSGETCWRCHSPRAWVDGRGAADGSALTFDDIDEGVGCNVCHRLVDPVFTKENPAEDQLILSALAMDPMAGIPMSQGNAQIVMDPSDVRRGPFSDVDPPHVWAHSPHHQTADLCATCHDVSNPVFDRVGGTLPSPTDTYVLNASMTEHPNHDKYHQFPEQRTYSEWLSSAYAQPGGIPVNNPADPYDLAGRFGGNATSVGKCQDCHMPDQTGQGCFEVFNPPVRNDLPEHSFKGANTFLLDLVLHVYEEDLTQYDVDIITRARGEVVSMIEAATDMELSDGGCELNVRVINQCGHKLLTGYPEGRRIWINVKFRDAGNSIVAERGFYDFATADLTTSDTKVYETKFGLDEYMAGQTGLPAGESFNLVLNNTIEKDNRIPPRGFTNAAFAAAQAHHVGYSYPDGQHWDDTDYLIPAGAVSAEVTVYYQTASKEYIEFLRDNQPMGSSAGTTLYDAWLATGMSAPIVMDRTIISVSAGPDGDADSNGFVNVNDLSYIVFRLGLVAPGDQGADVDGSGSVDVNDITYTVFRLGGSCS